MTLRLSFKKKLAVTLGLAVLGFAVLGTVAVLSLNALGTSAHRVADLRAVAETVEGARAAALELTVASRTLGPQTYETLSAEIDRVTQEQRDALAATAAVDFAGDSGKGLEAMGQALGTYAGQLHGWVTKKVELGLDEQSGLRGQFRQAAHELEQSLQGRDLQYQLLQVRRREKDFFLRGRASEVPKVHAEHEELTRKVDQLPFGTGDAYKPLLQQYLQAFDQAAQCVVEIGNIETALASLQGDMGKMAREAGGAVRAALGAAASEDEAVRGRARFTILGGSAVVVTCVLGLLLWVGATTGRSLSRIVALLKDMAAGDGDLTQRLPLHYADCSQSMGCNHPECASHGKREACWSHVGSMQLDPAKVQCPAVLSGKVTDCSTCKVFRAAQADEFDEIANWFNIFVEKILHVIAQVHGASLELASVAEELSASTGQIASGNEQVAAQSQAAATASEEMSVTVGQVAENAAAVSQASGEANQSATAGARIVSEAVAAMGAIAAVVQKAAATVRSLGERSESIGNVIEVIEDIADQTNLLALNAAIEAARAGEHGRGFAVVADEVRKLAEKTVKATQEIGATITSIQRESREAVSSIDQGQETVTHGTDLGARAGEAIQAIEGRIAGASGQTEQIATATEQLSATIREMATNMDEIAQGIQQNSAATIQIAQTAQTVSEKAEELKSLTGRFRI